MASENILTPTKPANKENLNSETHGVENGLSSIPPFPHTTKPPKLTSVLETPSCENTLPSTRISVTGNYSPNYYTKTTMNSLATDTTAPPNLASPSIPRPSSIGKHTEPNPKKPITDFLAQNMQGSPVNSTRFSTGFPLSLPNQNNFHQALQTIEYMKSPNYNEPIEFITSPFAKETTPVYTSSTLSPLIPSRLGEPEKLPLPHNNDIQKDNNGALPILASPTENYFHSDTIKFPSLEELCQMEAYKPQYSPLPTIRKRTSTNFDQGQRFEYISSFRELLSPHLGTLEMHGPHSPMNTDASSIKKLLESPENIPRKRHRGSLSLSTQTPQNISSPLPSPASLTQFAASKESFPDREAYIEASYQGITSPTKPNYTQRISTPGPLLTTPKEWPTSTPSSKPQLQVQENTDKGALSMNLPPNQPQHLPTNVLGIQSSTSASPLNTLNRRTISPPRGTLIINTRYSDIDSSSSEYSDISETLIPSAPFVKQFPDDTIVQSDHKSNAVAIEWPPSPDSLDSNLNDSLDPTHQETELLPSSGIEYKCPDFNPEASIDNNQPINPNKFPSSPEEASNRPIPNSPKSRIPQNIDKVNINNILKENNITQHQPFRAIDHPLPLNKSPHKSDITTLNTNHDSLYSATSPNSSKAHDNISSRNSLLRHPIGSSQTSTQDIDKEPLKSDPIRTQNRNAKRALLKKNHHLKHSLDILGSVKVDYDISAIMRSLTTALNQCKPPKAVELLRASNNRLEKDLESKRNLLDQMSKQEKILRDELMKEVKIIEDLEDQLQSEILQKEKQVLKDQKKEKEQADYWENFIGIKLIKFSRDTLIVSFSWNDRPWSNSLMEDLQSPPSTINPSGEPDNEVFKSNIWGDLGVWPPHTQLAIQWQPLHTNKMSTPIPRYRRTTHGNATVKAYQNPKLLKYLTSHNNYNESALYRRTSYNDDEPKPLTTLRDKDRIMKFKSIDLTKLRLQSQYNHKAQPDNSDENWRRLCDILREQLICIIEARLQDSMMAYNASEASRSYNENYGKSDPTQKDKLLNPYDFQLLETIIEEVYNNFNNAALLLKQFKMFIGHFRCFTTAQYDGPLNSKTKMQLKTGIFSAQDGLPCFWLTFELILQNALCFGSLIMAISNVFVNPMDPEDQDWDDTQSQKKKIEEALNKNLVEWKDELISDLSSPTEPAAIYSMSACVIETLKSINYDAGISLNNYDEFKAFLDPENQFIGNLMQFTNFIKTIKLTS